MDGLSGLELEYILEKDYKIEVESASDEGILILSNISNSSTIGQPPQFEVGDWMLEVGF